MSDMRNKPPAPWLRLMEAKGLGSYRRLGDAARMAHETARKVVTGQAVEDESVQRVADALGVDVELVRAMRDEGDRSDPWNPPPVARHLTPDERTTLSRLIVLMTSGREEGEDGGDTSPNSEATDRSGSVASSISARRSRSQPASERPTPDPTD